MNNQDFTTTIITDASPSQAYKAINNVRGWWSENINGDTDKLNSEFLYHYVDVHRARMKIIEMMPDKKVVWHVLDNYFKFTEDETEWTDTKIIFEITEKDGKTQVKFTHQGLVPDYECYQICNDAWTHYIQGSLKDLIEKGKGSPTPMDTATGEEKYPVSETGSKTIYHRLLIETPVETVYANLTKQEGLAGWWTPDTIAKPVTGTVSRFAFGPDYFKEMKVEELKAYSKVKWLCLKAQEEWIGTTITFDLEPHKKGAILVFHHDNWKNYTQEFAACSYAWALFLRSLKMLCETGKGLPFPDFDKY
ncbi:SRPBCC family protein [Flavobacterium beibuense]|uniref:Activator of Hsp90 ATPase 1 family protein n=1 Tax=Flavobacterium beibuense TaxID=657326 RepID=A0A444W433_9FLAO|nr:SRPBCC domain-containing protein [Flavobacterium beibuense]RYJ40523.1 Activator of Hsp90 ATPase 1 family protein [Flavobacterium beibuense]